MMLLALLLAGAAFQDIAGLDRAVAAFTGRPIGAEGGPRTAVDPRLRLAQCPTVAHVVAHATRTTRSSSPAPAPTGASSCPSSRPRGRACHARRCGPRWSRPLKAEPVIRRGDPVVIEAGSDGFSITREGVAMTDAAPGARFTVRVDDAKAPVQALAVAGGRARLPGWGE